MFVSHIYVGYRLEVESNSARALAGRAPRDPTGARPGLRRAP